MRVPVRDAARREVDPVESHQPLDARVELDLRGQHRVRRRVVEQLPVEARPVVELVSDGVPRAVRLPREHELQWKY